MALRYKILLTFCISVLLMIVQSNVTSYYTDQLQHVTSSLTSSVKTIRSLLPAQLLLNKLDVSIKNTLALTDIGEKINSVKNISVDMLRLEPYIKNTAKNLGNIKKFNPYIFALEFETEKLKQTIRWLGQKKPAPPSLLETNSILDSIQTGVDHIGNVFFKLNGDLEIEIQQSLISEQSLHNLPTIASTIVTILATVLMALLGFTLSRNIALDIDKINAYLLEISNEKFNATKPSITRKDEIYNLSDSVVSMAKKLAKTQMRLRGAISAMPSVLIGISKDYAITDWNVEAEKLTGKTLEDVSRQTIWEAYPILLNFKIEIDSAIKHNSFVKKENLENIFTSTNSKPTDNIDVCHEMTIYPIYNDYYHGAVIRIDDITEKIRINNIIYEKEKMLYVTSLFSGVAYELEVPLTTIKQNIKNIMRRIDQNFSANLAVSESLHVDFKILHQYLEARKIPDFLIAMEQSSEQATNIAHNLLSFSKKKRAIMLPFKMEQMVNSAIESTKLDFIVRKIIDFNSIEITRDFPTDLPDVYCYQVEIEQTLINIIKNSVYALSKVKNTTHKLIFTGYKDIANDSVILEIKDNGAGIDNKIIDKIFEPFFTTNAPGEGTGLGLPVSKGIIVENHHGHFEINSVVNVGTTVKISLPINQAS